jgi:hypothetical protein
MLRRHDVHYPLSRHVRPVWQQQGLHERQPDAHLNARRGHLVSRLRVQRHVSRCAHHERQPIVRLRQH